MPPAEDVEGVGGGKSLTMEKSEKQNQLEGQPEKGNVKVWYKNIPSPDAITARLAIKTCALSIGSTKTARRNIFGRYYGTKVKLPYTSAATDGTLSCLADSNGYEAGLTVIGEFNTAEDFCPYLNWLKPPSKLNRNSKHYLFKSGIKPMREDEANANGDKRIWVMKNTVRSVLEQAFHDLGGQRARGGRQYCGVVFSLRNKVDRIHVWTRSKDDVERLSSTGKKLAKAGRRFRVRRDWTGISV